MALVPYEVQLQIQGWFFHGTMRTRPAQSPRNFGGGWGGVDIGGGGAEQSCESDRVKGGREMNFKGRSNRLG